MKKHKIQEKKYYHENNLPSSISWWEKYLRVENYDVHRQREGRWNFRKKMTPQKFRPSEHCESHLNLKSSRFHSLSLTQSFNALGFLQNFVCRRSYWFLWWNLRWHSLSAFLEAWVAGNSIWRGDCAVWLARSRAFRFWMGWCVTCFTRSSWAFWWWGTRCRNDKSWFYTGTLRRGTREAEFGKLFFRTSFRLPISLSDRNWTRYNDRNRAWTLSEQIHKVIYLKLNSVLITEISIELKRKFAFQKKINCETLSSKWM